MSNEKKQYRIAVIPGDGIGKEVVPEGLRVLEAAAKKHGVAVHFDHFDFASWDYYEKHGEMMPDDWKAQIGKHDAIYFGAVGWPAKIPDHISLWGSLIKFRREFDQYVNLRPVRLMPGVPSPLANRKPGDIDFWVVRENTEGEYSSVGGRMFPDTDREFVTQQTVMTRIGVDRILKFAFELAQSRPKKHLTSATKSNGISITMPYWDERVEAMAQELSEGEVGQVPHRYPDREFRAASGLVRRRGRLESVRRYPVRSRPGLHRHHRHRAVGQHQSGGNFPSVFEPVHGSAPDIAGQGIANPIGMIWSGAMMLEHLGEKSRRGLDRRRDRAHARRTHAAHPGSRRQCRHHGVRQGGRGDGGVGHVALLLHPLPLEERVVREASRSRSDEAIRLRRSRRSSCPASQGQERRRVVHPFTILRQCSHAAPIRFSLASGVRKAECADSVTFGSLVSG